MIYLYNLNIPRDSSIVANCYLYSHCYKKNIQYLSSVCSSSECSPSSSSSCSSTNLSSTIGEVSFSSTISGQKLTGKYLRNGKNNCSRRLVAVMVKKPCARDRKRPLWKKLLLGPKKKLRSIIVLNIITIIYASDITIIKDVESFTDPAYFSAVRFAVSTIPFIPFMFKARKDVETRNSGLELGLWVSLGYLSEAVGLLTTDAGRASFISLFTVIVVPLLESVFGAMVPARTWFGILMSVLGISMLECGGSPPNIGDLFNFLGAIFFGVHTLRTEHISKTTKKENLLALLGYEVGVVAVLSTVWCLIGSINYDRIQDVCWTWGLLWDWIFAFPWIPALYTGVFSTGLCLWGEMAAMRDVSATETAVIYGLEPVWGAGFAWFLLGERWGIDGWVGAALILGGSLIVQMVGASAGESKRSSESREETSDRVMTVSSSDAGKLQRTLSTSAVRVNSRDDRMDMYS